MAEFHGSEFTGIDPAGIFTPRQLECLVWMAEGKENSAIAPLIGRQRSTAKRHVEDAMHKLDANSRCLAVSRAFARGFLKLRDALVIALALLAGAGAPVDDLADRYRRPPRSSAIRTIRTTRNSVDDLLQDWATST